MATTCTGFRLLLQQQLRCTMMQRLAMPSASVNSVRYKQRKLRRPKVPNVGKEKKKWMPKSSLVVTVVKDLRPTQSLNWLNKRPVDDVWIRCNYPKQSYSFEDCIKRHCEYAEPSMLDNMEGMVYANMLLNMTTKKKTKFMRNISNVVLLTHPFEDGRERRCAVFCKSEEHIALAKQLGAAFVGGTELVSDIVNENINHADIDSILCTPDMLVDLIPIRTMIKEKFPHKNRGNLGYDIESMMNLHMKGTFYTSTKESDSVGKAQIPLGKLNMSCNQLFENLHSAVESVKKEKPGNPGHFITQVEIIVPPSVERFLLLPDDYVAKETDNDEEEKDASAIRQ